MNTARDVRGDARGPVPVAREAVAGHPVRLSPFTTRNSPSGRTSRRKHPAANSKCPAGMPERRGVRSGIARGVGQVLRAAPVQPPCICGISKTETRDEDRRLDEKSKHRIRPVVAPAISSMPSCDNIMILSAENLATCGNFRAAKLPQKWSAQALGRHHARFAIREKNKLHPKAISRGAFFIAGQSPLLATRRVPCRGPYFRLRSGRTRTRALPGSRPRGRWRP